MTARKLPMPGVRDRIPTDEGGESAGAEAAAAAGRGGVDPLQQQQQRQNQDGYAAAPPPVAAGKQGSGSKGSTAGEGREGLGPSIMQPLPLASRYAGVAKHDTVRSASSALGSSWIRRFLPTTTELGKEATRVPTKAVLGGAAGGGGEPGSQPGSPLLLASTPDEHREQQPEEVEMAEVRRGFDTGEEPSVEVLRNVHKTQKGKGPAETESRQQKTTASWREFGENVGGGGAIRKVNTLQSHHPYVVEGGRRLQQPQGNLRNMPSTRDEAHANGTSGPVVRGFGPLRLGMNPPTRAWSCPKLKGMDVESHTEADVAAAAPAPAQPPDGPSTATLLPDRNKPIGAHTVAPQNGTKFTPISKSKVVEPWSGHPNRAVEFSSPWGLGRSKKQEVEPDGVGPSAVQPDGAPREILGVSGGLKGVDPLAARVNPFEGKFLHRFNTGHRKLSDHEGLERMKVPSSKVTERFGSSYLHANLGKKEEGGQGAENWPQHSRGVEEASPRPNHTGAGFPAGQDVRKGKEGTGCGFSIRRQTDTGGASEQQQQQLQEIPPFGSHQFPGDLGIGMVGQPLPFSPRSSFHGEDNSSGEDTRISRGRVDRPKSPLSTLFGSPKPYEDGLDGRAAQSEQQPPWASLFAAFRGPHPEPANSASSTPTLPPEVLPRVQDGSSIPANRPFEVPKVRGDQDESSGGNDSHPPASPEARSRFDNQSSHFSNSPWLDEENRVISDEAGTGPYNSQASGPGYHSQASRVANRSEGDTKRRQTSAYRYDTGSVKEVSASEPDPRTFARKHREDQGQQMSNDETQALNPLEHFTRQAISGHKDDTSGSSPPSFPPGYNFLDVGSLALPRGIVDLSLAGNKSRKADSEMEGVQVPRTQKGHRKERLGFATERPMDNMNSSSKPDNAAGFRDHKDARAFPQRDINREVSRHGRSHEGPAPGISRLGKLRKSDEAIGEGGISGSAKRTCHHPNPGASEVGSQGGGAATPSAWLSRWSTGNAAKPPAGVAMPIDNPRNGLTSEPPSSNGNTDIDTRFHNDNRSRDAKRAETARGKEIDRQWKETRVRNGMKDGPAQRGLNGLPVYPTPSAKAIALVGTAARKPGPFPQQRKGSFSMWPPVHLQTVQATPEAQLSQSSELSL